MKVVWVYFEQLGKDDSGTNVDLRLFDNQPALRKYVARRKKELDECITDHTGINRLKLRHMSDTGDIKNIVAEMSKIIGLEIRVWLEEVVD